LKQEQIDHAMVVLEPSYGSWWVQHWLAPNENTRISKVKQTRPQTRMKARKQESKRLQNSTRTLVATRKLFWLLRTSESSIKMMNTCSLPPEVIEETACHENNLNWDRETFSTTFP
jgi:hypothetical protein